MTAPIDDARRLLRDRYATEALTHLGAASTSEATLLRARGLMALERYDAAFSLLAQLASRKDLSDARRAEANIVRARLLRTVSMRVDEAIELVRSAIRLSDRLAPPVRIPLAHEASLELARLYARKRTRELAEAQLARARETHANDPETICCAAEVLVAFDDRDGAIERYRAALVLGDLGERLGRAGWAHVAMLIGQFDQAHHLLDSLGAPRSGEAHVRRTRIRLLTAQQRWVDVVAAYDDMARHNPESDLAARDEYERACATYRAGWVSQARAAFDRLGRAAGQSHYVELARRNARLLSRPDVQQRRWCRLTAFPTVAQLRSHCGPASCELYLRYFGVPASQVEVARAIKEPESGTPVYRMRRFLDQAGFHTRRVEAKLPLLRRLIDAGVPVIMEERYAESGHVAVAIGYDDIREILEVQDPMSHEIRETRYEQLDKLGDLSNHGGLIAVPKQDAALLAKLDDANAVECRYIALVDQAWAAMDEGRPEEGDRFVEESIALRRDYELAWFYKFERAVDRATKDWSADAKVALFQVAAEVAAIWPDQDWPNKFRGEALAMDGRYSEALAAFERARDRDPDDPRTWAQIGACQMALGRNDDAFDTLQRALERNPSHPTANARLALLMLERGDGARATGLNEAARRLAPKFALTHHVHGKLLAKKGDHEGAVAAYTLALTLDPRRASTVVDQARSLAMLGKLDVAVSALEAAVTLMPQEKWLRVEVPQFLFNNEKYDLAETKARALLATEPKNATAVAIVGACQLARGERDEGFATLRSALALQPTNGWVYRQMGRFLANNHEHARAIESFAAALGLASAEAEPEREYDLGCALSYGGYAEAAAVHLTRAGIDGELGEDALVKIGEAIAAARRPAKPFFEKVLSKRPDDPDVLRAYARTMLELNWAPDLAAPLLDRLALLAPNDPYAKAQSGAAEMDATVEREVVGEARLREAMTAAPTREFPRRALGERLVQRGRDADALEVLAPCKTHYQVLRLRVRALLGLGRLSEIEEQFAAFDKAWSRSGDGRESFGVRSLRYEVLVRKGDYTGALALAEQLSREEGEREDDGRLDTWEVRRFECMLRSGDVLRAHKFGTRQALDAVSLGRLGLLALDAGAVVLAEEIGQRLLRLVHDNPTGTFLSLRAGELRNDHSVVPKMAALAAKERRWHRVQAAMARIALAQGDLVTADSRAAAAVLAGHLFVEVFVTRAACRWVAGDRHGATTDLDRAYAVARPEAREREHLDGWAMRAQLRGDRTVAEDLYTRYLTTPLSWLDRARIERVRNL